jgi:hypothetical protein
MNEDNVADKHNGILFGHEKELNSLIFSKMGGPGGH